MVAEGKNNTRILKRSLQLLLVQLDPHRKMCQKRRFHFLLLLLFQVNYTRTEQAGIVVPIYYYYCIDMVSWGIAKIKGIFPRHMCLYRDAFLLVFLVPYNFHAVSMDVHSVGAVLLNYSKLHVRYLPFDTTVFGPWKELCAPMPECVIYIQSVTTREENARKRKRNCRSGNR